MPSTGAGWLSSSGFLIEGKLLRGHNAAPSDDQGQEAKGEPREKGLDWKLTSSRFFNRMQKYEQWPWNRRRGMRYVEISRKQREDIWNFFDKLDKTGCLIFPEWKIQIYCQRSAREWDVFATLAAEWESDIRLSGSCPATGYTRSLEDRTRQH